MYKLVCAGLLIVLVHGNVFPQAQIQGVAIKKIDQYKPGDTINIYGFKQKSGGESYLIRSGYGDKYVSSNKIRLLDANMGYWQTAWLENQASHIRSRGWQSDLRMARKDDFYEYATDGDQRVGIQG